MKLVFMVSFLMVVLLAGGCATGSWRAGQVPYPQSTPFDSNHMARAAYRDGFARGYQAVMSGTGGTVELLSGPYFRAREQGFYAGAAHAHAEAAERTGAR